MLNRVLPLFGALAAASGLQADEFVLRTFEKIHLTPEFWAEGAAFADFNRDGRNDVVYGPFWYEGPDFSRRHEYRPAVASFTKTRTDGNEVVTPGYEGCLGLKNAYSDNFFAWTADFNHDGWMDIFIVGMPGEKCFWFENPKGRGGHWRRHVGIDSVDNESPAFADLTGDGRPELICNSGGCFGYAEPNWAEPEKPWVWRAISPNNKYHRYNHGLGIGDVNGDGRLDLLERDGWWQQPVSLDDHAIWKLHEFPFCPPTDDGVPVGGAQLFAYDVNGDGLNDVITCLAAHGYGLAWYEQVQGNGQIDFKRHLFVNKLANENRFGVRFSQPHALDMADMDGDGLLDLVTGKRIWAHGPGGDPEPIAPAVLYWFKLVRSEEGAEFVPHLIDGDSGVGTQVMAGDVDGDGLPDIVMGNKKGGFVFLQRAWQVNGQAWEQAQPKLWAR